MTRAAFGPSSEVGGGRMPGPYPAREGGSSGEEPYVASIVTLGLRLLTSQVRRGNYV